jgi:hypothetical protein
LNRINRLQKIAYVPIGWQLNTVGGTHVKNEIIMIGIKLSEGELSRHLTGFDGGFLETYNFSAYRNIHLHEIKMSERRHFRSKMPALLFENVALAGKD